MNKNFLNLGCGNTYIESWTNIDFTSNSSHVIEHNLLKGIPFENNKFNVVYHSHVLEHFSKADGENLLKECYRVMEKGGILRIAIPDLEQIANSYITSLKNVIAEDNEINNANYDWAVIELIDQLVRSRSGGQMSNYWNQDKIINEEFIIERVGYEFKNYRDQLLKKKRPPSLSMKKIPLIKRIKNKLVSMFNYKQNKRVSKYEELGMFRLSGEIHQWMYDRHSITKLLTKLGFENVKIVTAFESSIPNWDKYCILDVIGNEKRKPDSLYIEATK